MVHYKEQLITIETPIRVALQKLDMLAGAAIVFVVDDLDRLQGSLTDGDVRRGLLKGITIDEPVRNIIQQHPKYIRKGARDIFKIIEYRTQGFRIIPVLDAEDKVVNILNFNNLRSYLPIDAVIMAGGRGQRLKPLTDDRPKPLLKVGDKTIMEHNVDRLALYGIDNFWFSVNYLGHQIVDYFGDGTEKNRFVHYIWEDEPLGTIGSVAKIENFKHEHVLVSNSDILTNLDYEAFYIDFLEKDADFAVATIPYYVSTPDAVVETANGHLLNFKEKPTDTYYSNGGIYLMKRSVLDYIPKGQYFDATDLMEKLIAENKKVVSYPLVGYWLDVGKHADFEKAQKDIHTIKF